MNSLFACFNPDHGRMDPTPPMFVSCPDDSSDGQGGKDHGNTDDVSLFIRDLIMISFDNQLQISEKVKSVQLTNQEENSSEVFCQEILNNMMSNTITRCEGKPVQNEEIRSEDEDQEKSSENICQEILIGILKNVIVCAEENQVDSNDHVIELNTNDNDNGIVIVGKNFDFGKVFEKKKGLRSSLESFAVKPDYFKSIRKEKKFKFGNLIDNLRKRNFAFVEKMVSFNLSFGPKTFPSLSIKAKCRPEIEELAKDLEPSSTMICHVPSRCITFNKVSSSNHQGKSINGQEGNDKTEVGKPEAVNVGSTINRNDRRRSFPDRDSDFYKLSYYRRKLIEKEAVANNETILERFERKREEDSLPLSSHQQNGEKRKLQEKVLENVKRPKLTTDDLTKTFELKNNRKLVVVLKKLDEQTIRIASGGDDLNNLTNPFKCGLCNVTFSEASQLFKHATTGHADNNKVPSTSNQSSIQIEPSFVDLVDDNLKISAKNKSVENVSKHAVQKNYQSPSFICKFCSSEFKQEQMLKSHLATAHHITSSFACFLCDLNFNSASGMMVHIRTAHEPYKCKYCKKQFSRRRCLHNHTRAKHAQNVNSYSCSKCDKKFSTKGILGRHFQTFHSSVRSDDISVSSASMAVKIPVRSINTFQCDSCNRIFINKIQFENHIKLEHQAAKPNLTIEKLHSSSKRSVHRKQDCSKTSTSQTGLGKNLIDEPRRVILTQPEVIILDEPEIHDKSVPMIMESNKTSLESKTTKGDGQKKLDRKEKGSNGEAKKFRCETCGKGFAHKGFYEKHLRTMHKNSNLSFPVKKTIENQNVPKKIIHFSEKSTILANSNVQPQKSNDIQIEASVDNPYVDTLKWNGVTISKTVLKRNVANSSIKPAKMSGIVKTGGNLTIRPVFKVQDQQQAVVGQDQRLTVKGQEKHHGIEVGGQHQSVKVRDQNQAVKDQHQSVKVQEQQQGFMVKGQHQGIEVRGQHEAIKARRQHQAVNVQDQHQATKVRGQHQAVKKSSETFRCRKCGQGFSNQGLIARHMRIHHLAFDPLYHPGLSNSVESSIDVSNISSDISFGVFDSSTKEYKFPKNSMDLTKSSKVKDDSLDMSRMKIVDPMLILQRGLDELRQTLTSSSLPDVDPFDDVTVRKKAKMSTPILARKKIGRKNKEEKKKANSKQTPIVIEF